MEVKWQDPPATKQGTRSTEVARMVEVLKQNPGRWALVREGVPSSYVQPWKRRGCEAQIRTLPDGHGKKFDVYARWPEKEAEPVKQMAPTPRIPERTRATAPKTTPGAAKPVTAAATRTTIPDIPGMTPPATLNMDDPKDVALWEQRVRFEQSRRRRQA